MEISCYYIMIFTHYNDVIMSTMASQITGIWIVYSTACSGADRRKHQNSPSLAFDDVIMSLKLSGAIWHPGTYSTLVQVIAWWLMAPSHFLNQCWHIVNMIRSAFQLLNLIRNSKFFFQENAFEKVICKCQLFCSGLNVFPLWLTVKPLI